MPATALGGQIIKKPKKPKKPKQSRRGRKGDAVSLVLRIDQALRAMDEAFAPQLFRLHNLHCLVTELSGKVNPGSRDAGSEAV